MIPRAKTSDRDRGVRVHPAQVQDRFQGVMANAIQRNLMTLIVSLMEFVTAPTPPILTAKRTHIFRDGVCDRLKLYDIDCQDEKSDPITDEDKAEFYRNWIEPIGVFWFSDSDVRPKRKEEDMFSEFSYSAEKWNPFNINECFDKSKNIYAEQFIKGDTLMEEPETRQLISFRFKGVDSFFNSIFWKVLISYHKPLIITRTSGI